MEKNIEDRLTIADLVAGWIHRDLGDWDRLRNLFHPDATIEVTWFEGFFLQFVEASLKMGASDLRTKHLVTSPHVTINKTRAIAEANIVIICENPKLGLFCTQHARFFDAIEMRNNVWRIASRKCLYDMCSFSAQFGAPEIDAAALAKFPREYAPLAYILEKSGFEISRISPTKGGGQEKAIKTSALSWISA